MKSLNLVLAIVTFSLTTVGCGQVNSPMSKQVQTDPEMVAIDTLTNEERTRLRAVTVIPAPIGAELINENEVFDHKPSGTRFYYPKGWEILDSRTGLSTSLGLRREDVGEVTLFWREADPGNFDDEILLAIALDGLKQVYGDKVSIGNSVKVGDKSGYQFNIKGPPSLVENPNLRGVVYVFYIRSAVNKTWIVKVRATAESEEKLKDVQPLLHYFQWTPL
jgi:hypothetical protein